MVQAPGKKCLLEKNAVAYSVPLSVMTKNSFYDIPEDPLLRQTRLKNVCHLVRLAFDSLFQNVDLFM